MGRVERLLMVLTPAVALAVVVLGLRVGAGERVRAAMVYGAPQSHAGVGQAWQLAVFDEERGVREPVRLDGVEVVARAGTSQVTWRLSTNEDGAAELALPLKQAPDLVQVTAGGKVLVTGRPVPGPAPEPAGPLGAWARFARRSGPVSLDVALLGQRAASGFPASIWIRARDASSGEPREGMAITVDSDPGLTPVEPKVTTDALGWAHMVVTPMGFVVPLVLHAEYAGARTGPPAANTGEWAGGLFISPGASRIDMQDRYAPGLPIALMVTVPTVRKTAYVEIDDTAGRAWAVTAPLPPSDTEMPRAALQAPPLAPGLYWAIAADDPTGAAKLGPGSIARPFFVANSDETALAFGTDPDSCVPPADIRETARVLSACLALVYWPRSLAGRQLDGFAFQGVRNARRRAMGLSIALGAIVIAVILECLLLFRAATSSRARLRAASAENGAGNALANGRVWGLVVSSARRDARIRPPRRFPHPTRLTEARGQRSGRRGQCSARRGQGLERSARSSEWPGHCSAGRGHEREREEHRSERSSHQSARVGHPEGKRGHSSEVRGHALERGAERLEREGHRSDRRAERSERCADRCPFSPPRGGGRRRPSRRRARGRPACGRSVARRRRAWGRPWRRPTRRDRRGARAPASGPG